MVRLVASLTLAASVGVAASAQPHVLFRLADPRLTESSGIAAGIRSPGVFYVHNDGGDAARFFAIDRATGRVRADVRVPGAVNVDWEDIAVARSARGVASVWVADTGDNRGMRSQVQIYRVDEPRVPAGSPHTITTGPADVWRLRYPKGRPDAESLAVAPGGRAYLVTKNAAGASTVYQVPSAPSGRVQVLRRVGSVRFHLTGTPGGPAGPLGNLMATGAALSRDGHRFVIRTYTDAWFWRVTKGGMAAALRRRPVHMPLPAQPQGEGITFAGESVVVDSQLARSRVWSVPVPRMTARTASASVLASPAATPPEPGAAKASRAASGHLAAAVTGALALGIGALTLALLRRPRH